MAGETSRYAAGDRLGRWTVLGLSKHKSTAHRFWDCRCDCGTVKPIRSTLLRSGQSRSCGCSLIKLGPVEAPPGWFDRAKPTADLSYMGAHQRVRRTRGAASLRDCIDCGLRAHDWSLRHDATDRHLDGAPGTSAYPMWYSGDPDDYEPRCRKCHKAYDRLTRSGDFPQNYMDVVDTDPRGMVSSLGAVN